MNIPINSGDWIAFCRDSKIYYAAVVYLKENLIYPYTTTLITTEGAVQETEVLEVRSKSEVESV